MDIRPAERGDLAAIVDMLAADPLGAQRERPGDPPDPVYREAFAAITAQQGNQVLVALDGVRVIGCLQLTFIPGLARCGMLRAQIEAVRVIEDKRSAGIGEALFRHAIALAREAGCGLVQLTSDKGRPDAHRFYDRLGFVASHEGYKLMLGEGA